MRQTGLDDIRNIMNISQDVTHKTSLGKSLWQWTIQDLNQFLRLICASTPLPPEKARHECVEFPHFFFLPFSLVFPLPKPLSVTISLAALAGMESIASCKIRREVSAFSGPVPGWITLVS